jgi:hypothetical protein
VGLRAAGLGSVKGVILGREKGVALGCDLTDKDAIVVVVPHVTAHDGEFLRLDTHLADGEFCFFVARSGLALFDTVTTMSLGGTFLNPNARSGAMPVT